MASFRCQGTRWAAGGALALGIALQAQAAVLVNEVLPDPSGDANRDGIVHPLQDEFIELVNTGGEDVFLAGWSLADLVQVRHRFADAALIPGRGLYVVFGGGAPSGFSAVATASSRGLGLNNGGDTIALSDVEGALLDAVSYGADLGRGRSWTRVPDGSTFFAAHPVLGGSAYSPGLTVEGVGALPPLPSPREPILPSPPEPILPTPEPSMMVLWALGVLGTRRLIRLNHGYEESL